MIVLFNPVTYCLLATMIAICENLSGPAAPLIRRVIVGAALTLLMPPLAYIADRWFAGGETDEQRLDRRWVQG